MSIVYLMEINICRVFMYTEIWDRNRICVCAKLIYQ